MGEILPTDPHLVVAATWLLLVFVLGVWFAIIAVKRPPKASEISGAGVETGPQRGSRRLQLVVVGAVAALLIGSTAVAAVVVARWAEREFFSPRTEIADSQHQDFDREDPAEPPWTRMRIYKNHAPTDDDKDEEAIAPPSVEQMKPIAVPRPHAVPPQCNPGVRHNHFLDFFLSYFIEGRASVVHEFHIGGNQYTQPELIVAAIGSEPEATVFKSDLPCMRERLLALPWASDVKITLQSHAVYLDFVEKVPIGIWRASDEQFFVIDKFGVPITQVYSSEQFRKSIVILGGDPASAAPVLLSLKKHLTIASNVVALEQFGERWNLILRGGETVVKLPISHWEERLDRLERMWPTLRKRSAAEIDLRAETQVMLLLRNGRKETLHVSPN